MRLPDSITNEVNVPHLFNSSTSTGAHMHQLFFDLCCWLISPCHRQCGDSPNRAQLLGDDVWLFMCQWSEDQHVGLPQEGHKRIPQGDYQNVRNAGEWSPFLFAWGQKEAEWRAGGCFPSHSVPAPFRSKQSKARHPNGCVLPRYSSEGTRQRRLGEAGESTEVHKWDMIYEANPKRRRDELHSALVRGRVASDPRRLPRKNWTSNDNGEGSSNQFVEHNEVQYMKLQRNGIDISARQTAW